MTNDYSTVFITKNHIPVRKEKLMFIMAVGNSQETLQAEKLLNMLVEFQKIMKRITANEKLVPPET